MRWTPERLAELRAQHAVLAVQYQNLKEQRKSTTAWWQVKQTEGETDKVFRKRRKRQRGLDIRLMMMKSQLLDLESMRAKGGKYVIQDICVKGKTRRRTKDVAVGGELPQGTPYKVGE
jgi:hypothetical protein